MLQSGCGGTEADNPSIDRARRGAPAYPSPLPPNTALLHGGAARWPRRTAVGGCGTTGPVGGEGLRRGLRHRFRLNWDRVPCVTLGRQGAGGWPRPAIVVHGSPEELAAAAATYSARNDAQAAPPGPPVARLGASLALSPPTKAEMARRPK